MEEGPAVTGKTGGEEARGARACVTFHSSSGFPFSKALPGQGAHLGLGGMGDSSLGRLNTSLDKNQGLSIILPPWLS